MSVDLSLAICSCSRNKSSEMGLLRHVVVYALVKKRGLIKSVS